MVLLFVIQIFNILLKIALNSFADKYIVDEYIDVNSMKKIYNQHSNLPF